MSKHKLSNRDSDIISMYIMIFQELANRWGKPIREISNIAEEYNLLPYIEACYDIYNSTGTEGIMIDIEEYIRDLGGTIQ